ncbi:MAG: carboxymuconolactone decarboxylase family protein [Eggerthellaceae bacterium]|nr:carboxymuconolactone decarboxylase family protein [Eggerthellaceae bacterium]
MGYIDELAAAKAQWGEFAKLSPDVIEGFGQVRSASCKDGKAIDFKTIELISVAVSVARKCEPCMLAHVQVCVDLGVTREELAAALNPTIMLCGGPGWAYSAKALAAFDEMSAAKE